MTKQQAVILIESYLRQMKLSADEHDRLKDAVKVVAENLGLIEKAQESSSPEIEIIK